MIFKRHFQQYFSNIVAVAFICGGKREYPEKSIVGSNTGKVKPMTIKLFFADSSLSMHHEGVAAVTGWLGIRIMYQSGATCLPVDCCFIELPL